MAFNFILVACRDLFEPHDTQIWSNLSRGQHKCFFVFIKTKPRSHFIDCQLKTHTHKWSLRAPSAHFLSSSLSNTTNHMPWCSWRDRRALRSSGLPKWRTQRPPPTWLQCTRTVRNASKLAGLPAMMTLKAPCRNIWQIALHGIRCGRTCMPWMGNKTEQKTRCQDQMSRPDVK